MVCPNCGSNEVITVQGENYCINCGQLIVKSAPAGAVSTDGLPDGVEILPVGEAAIVNHATKRKPGRPKAGRLDVPAAATARVIAAEPTPEAAPPELAPAFQDIAPPEPKPQSSKLAAKVTLPPVAKTVAIAFGEALADSIGGRFTHKRWLMTLVPGAIVAGVATVIGLILASHHASSLVPVALSARYAIGGELVIIAILYYLVRSLTHAAITLGTARLADHRPLTPDRWLPAAADSQGRRLSLDIAAGIGLIAVVVLVAELMTAGSSRWPVPELVQTAALMVGYATLLYVALALVMTVSLGHIAATLVHVRAFSAAKLGWKLFEHHFELAGARLCAVIVEFIGLVVVLVGAGGWLVVTPAGLRPLVIIAVGAVLAASAALAGAGTAIWWTNVYRQLVSADHPAGFHRLLATAIPKAPRRGSAIVVGLSVVILSGLAVIWPFLPR